MITIIFGMPGSGKTSLLTHFLKTEYARHGRALLARSREQIAKFCNGRALSVPEKPPLFANYKVTFVIGYKKTFQPYFVNPYYMGLPNANMPVQFLPSCAKVFITEAQRYYNSRKSATLPDHVSRFFEMHRHFGLDVYLDAQRANLIDLNIKEIAKRFIEVREMRHEHDFSGRIVRSRFFCREFDGWRAVEQYMQAGAKTYRENVIVNEGDIFRAFDSFSCAEEFLPREGEDFDCIAFAERGERHEGRCAAFYNLNEPAAYRAQGRKTVAEGKKDA